MWVPYWSHHGQSGVNGLAHFLPRTRCLETKLGTPTVVTLAPRSSWREPRHRSPPHADGPTSSRSLPRTSGTATLGPWPSSFRRDRRAALWLYSQSLPLTQYPLSKGVTWLGLGTALPPSGGRPDRSYTFNLRMLLRIASATQALGLDTGTLQSPGCFRHASSQIRPAWLSRIPARLVEPTVGRHPM